MDHEPHGQTLHHDIGQHRHEMWVRQTQGPLDHRDAKPCPRKRELRRMTVGSQAYARKCRGGECRLREPEVGARAIGSDKVVIGKIVQRPDRSPCGQVVDPREETQRHVAQLAGTQGVTHWRGATQGDIRLLLGKVGRSIAEFDLDGEARKPCTQGYQHGRQHLQSHELRYRKTHHSRNLARRRRGRAQKGIRSMCHGAHMFVERTRLLGGQ